MKPNPNSIQRILEVFSKKAGVSKKLPSDDIIKLYRISETIQKVRPEDATKIMKFIRGLKVQKDNYISESYLESIIRSVVRECINEEFPSLNQTTTIADIPEKNRRSVALQTLSNPDWNSPISREDAAAYLKQLGYSDAQIEDLASKDVYLDEESGTAAVSPVSTPFAFKKKELDERDQGDNPKIWVKSKNDILYHNDTPGMEYSVSKTTPPRPKKFGHRSPPPQKQRPDSLDDLKEFIRNIVKEMTTTGAVSGYNVPGAFSGNKMKSKDHIEVLGYKLTPSGEKEYHRKGDKLI